MTETNPLPNPTPEQLDLIAQAATCWPLLPVLAEQRASIQELFVNELHIVADPKVTERVLLSGELTEQQKAAMAQATQCLPVFAAFIKCRPDRQQFVIRLLQTIRSSDPADEQFKSTARTLVQTLFKPEAAHVA
jgi:hypothetical protein